MKTDIEPDAGAMTSFGNRWWTIVAIDDRLGSVEPTAYLRSRAGKPSHAISLTNCGTMDKTLISNRSFFGRVFPLGTQPKSSIFLPTRSEFSITLSSHCNLLTQPNGIDGTASSLLLAKEGMLLGKEGRSNSSITEIEIPCFPLYLRTNRDSTA